MVGNGLSNGSNPTSRLFCVRSLANAPLTISLSWVRTIFQRIGNLSHGRHGEVQNSSEVSASYDYYRRMLSHLLRVTSIMMVFASPAECRSPDTKEECTESVLFGDRTIAKPFLLARVSIHTTKGRPSAMRDRSHIYPISRRKGSDYFPRYTRRQLE